MTQVLDRETIEQRVVVHHTWEQFKLIQALGVPNSTTDIEVAKVVRILLVTERSQSGHFDYA